MSLVLDLPPETEIRLREAAAREGLDASAFLRALLEERLRELPGQAAPLYTTATTEGLNQALDAVALRNQGRPVLPAGAFDRESLYDERL